MTKQEAAIISAFTGVLIGKFSDLHEYIEKIIGRPVFTHEMGGKNFMEEVKEAARPDFLRIHENIEE